MATSVGWGNAWGWQTVVQGAGGKQGAGVGWGGSDLRVWHYRGNDGLFTHASSTCERCWGFWQAGGAAWVGPRVRVSVCPSYHLCSCHPAAAQQPSPPKPGNGLAMAAIASRSVSILMRMLPARRCEARMLQAAAFLAIA
jgi:hypothetical protein